MPSVSLLQTSFLGGEWSKFSQGRVDEPNYKRAMNICYNAFPIEEGVWVRRPGTQFAYNTRNGKPGRIHKFAFSGSAPFTMEFTDGHVRFRTGAQLCYGSDFTTVASITGGPPAVVQTTAATTWAVGDQVIFIPQDIPSQLVAAGLQWECFQITSKPTSTTFTATNSITGAPITALAAMNCIVGRVIDLPTLYTNGMWEDLRFIQSEFQMMLLHPDVQPYLLSVTPPTLLQVNQFVPTANNLSVSLSQVQFLDGPYLDPSPTADIFTPGPALGGPGALELDATSIKNINNGQGFLPTDVGRLIRLYSAPQAWVSSHSYNPGDAVEYGGLYYLQVAVGSSLGQPPATTPSAWGQDPQLASWTWWVIQTVLSPTRVMVDGDGPDFLYAGSTVPMIFALGAFSFTSGWPTCGCWHEGRFWLGGCIPNRFDGSVANNVFNPGQITDLGPQFAQIDFAPTDQGGTIQLAGAVLDSSAISYTLNSEDTNQIFWMKGNVQGIIIGTPGGEYLVQASSSNNVLTPTSIQAHRVTKYECENIEPVNAGLTTVFVQKYGRRLFEYLSDIFSGRFYGPNLSLYTKHITHPGIAELARQELLAPIVWMRMNDGSFAGTTYRRISLFSSQPAEFNGWHRHALGSGNTITSITDGPMSVYQTDQSGGLFETVSFVTFNSTTGLYQVEIMTNIQEEDDLFTDAWYLDGGVTPCAATTYTSSGVAAGITLYGLNMFNGQTVTVFAAGLGLGSYLVSNGQINVPYKSDPDQLFTANWIATNNTTAENMHPGMPVDGGANTIQCVVGFPYVSQGQLLRNLEALPGSNGPGLGKTRRLHMFGALLNMCVTNQISFGTDFANTLQPAIFKTPGGKLYTRATPYSGVYWNTINSDYNFDGMLSWQVTGPYPANVVAIETFFEQMDR